MAARSPRPKPNGTTTRIGACIVVAATIVIDPTTTRMKVPRSSARYFRAFIPSSAVPRARHRATAVSQLGRAARRSRTQAGTAPSGGQGDRLAVGGDVDGDSAVRAVDARREEAVEDQVRITPGAFDRDHGRQPAPV